MFKKELLVAIFNVFITIRMLPNNFLLTAKSDFMFPDH